MADIRAFKGYRPKADLADRIAALPYDVYNRQEAKLEVEKEPMSFLKIDRAETNFDDTVDTYADCVYEKARDILDSMIMDGSFIHDEDDVYYIYELTMDGRSQTGLVAVSSIDDYLNNVIKKHENTRADKEIDRINHVDICNAQTGPIFLAYKRRDDISNIVSLCKKADPVYDFVSPDDIRHRVWVVKDKEYVDGIKKGFDDTDSIYIADGHHRAASAVKVGLKRRQENPNYTGAEEFNYFLSVLFPHDDLMIMPYNRVVKDLSSYDEESFLNEVLKSFYIERASLPVSPSEKNTYGMFLNNKWYKLRAHEDIVNDDPVLGLDVSILQDNLLHPILGINDPRTDKRIDFVGGIRGLKELEDRCNDDMKIAFSMFPTSIIELFNVADANMLMPPKSTWFEPKLRSGIFIHKL